MKIRIRFRKWGVMKFIGHLDMMRYFQKAMRRADIDICYSEGFSPHQIMSFAAPLGVGITSDGEYFDIEVHSSRSSEESLHALNDTMVDGVEVTGYVKLPDHAKTAMSLVAAADYLLYYKPDYELPMFGQFNDTVKAMLPPREDSGTLSLAEWRTLIDVFFHKEQSFTITKKTKKSERELDLKPLVFSFDVCGTDDAPEFYLFVNTGSTDNIKPELVLSSFFERLGLCYQTEAIQIHRLDTYAQDSNTGTYISLLSMGEELP